MFAAEQINRLPTQKGKLRNPLFIFGLIILVSLALFVVLFLVNNNTSKVTTKVTIDTPTVTPTVLQTNVDSGSLTPTVIQETVSLSIDINDGSFSQKTINLKVGIKYNITVTNKGKEMHTLSSGLINTGVLAPQQSIILTVIPTTVGTFEFNCAVPCGRFHFNMQNDYQIIVSS